MTTLRHILEAAQEALRDALSPEEVAWTLDTYNPRRIP